MKRPGFKRVQIARSWKLIDFLDYMSRHADKTHCILVGRRGFGVFWIPGYQRRQLLAFRLTTSK